MKKIMILICIILLFAGCSQKNAEIQGESETQVNYEQGDDNNYTEINVEGYNYRFEPSEIILKKGEKVRIRFKSEEGFHDLVSDELGIATQKLREDERDEIFITVNELGEFEFYCSVGDHRDLGMIGTIRVVE